MNIKKTIKKLMSRIPVIFCKIKDDDYLNDNLWIHKTYRLYRHLNRLNSWYSFTYYFDNYANTIKKLIDYKEDNKEIIRNHLVSAFYNSNNDEKMYIHCILAKCHLLNDSIVEMILNDVNSSDDIDYRYWLSLDISYSTFYCGCGYYSDYYRLRNNIFNNICKDFLPIIDCNLKKHINEHPQKLMLVMYTMSPDIHNSEQRVSVMIANRMKLYFQEISIICIDSLYANSVERKNYCLLGIHKDSSIYADEIEKLYDNEVKIQFAKGNSYKQRFQDAFNKIYNYNPDMIIDISDDYNPLACYYSDLFFTVFQPLRVGVTSQKHSVILGSKSQIEEYNRKYRCAYINNIVDWSFPEYIPSDSNPYKRSDYGFPDNSFIIFSIGNNESIPNELVDLMNDYLYKNNDCIWVLVGSNGPSYMHEVCQEQFAKRAIVEWGYENDLPGLCGLGDIVLRHNVTGGSGGTAIAAMHGLPIVMTDFLCDANRWLGRQYSTIHSYIEMINEVDRLKNDKEYYMHRQSECLSLVKKSFDSQEKWEELYTLLIEKYNGWRIKHG